MSMQRAWSRVMGLCLVVAVSIAGSASADVYPSKPVRIIMSTAAGSAPDVIARILSDRLTQIWGQQIVIINRPGAGGLLAAQAAVAAEPDGYTLYLPSASSLVVLPEQQKLAFDMEKEFAPIGLIGYQPFVIAVSPSLGVNTLAELIALAKKKPGEIMYAGNFRGSLPNLTGELFRNRSGAEITFVPYAGVAQAFQDILAGRVPVVIEGVSALSGALQQGTIKALAVTSRERIPNMKDIPAVAETVPGYESTGWFVLMAPAKTPDDVIQKVNKDLRAVQEQPEVRQRLEALATYTRPYSPAETATYIKGERDLWRPLVKQVGAPAQ